jgi:putative membrane protein
MNRLTIVAFGTFLGSSLPALAQHEYGPWRMHEWMGWGWGGMWLGPLFMLVLLGLPIAFVVALVRWLGGDRGSPSVTLRGARETLDERYARGEIDRDEYLKRRQDISTV